MSSTDPPRTELPLVGLSGRRRPGSAVVGIADAFADHDLDVYFADFARGIIAAGGLPVYVPLDVDPVAAMSRLDALVLTGGADLDPSLYGAAPQADGFTPEPERDRYELALLDAAYRTSMPVLGICRGLQLMAVAEGGTLHQDVPPHSRFDLHPATLVHDVAVTPGSTLHELVGDRLAVNSLHHQTIDRLPDGWVVTAVADDGTIEAIEAPHRRSLAVQWHPELLDTRDVDPLFTWVVEAARR